MLLRSSRLHYPVTVTRLYVDSGNEVASKAPLLEYKYKATVTKWNELGEEYTQGDTFYGNVNAPVEGILEFWKVKVGTVIEQDGVQLLSIEEPCLHEVQFAGLCTNCGKDMTEVDFASTAKLTDRANVNIAHGSTQLLVSQNEASRISEDSRKRLLAGRKLSLVVDLDQTVIHCGVDPTIGEWKHDPENPNYEVLQDVRAFQLPEEGPRGRASEMWYYIKVRPGLMKFFEEVSKHYEMHVYTMATRAYAHNVCKIIDPDRKIFADRIISRDESGSVQQKNLHRLFPVDTKMVVIIDDRGDVWNWTQNLIKVIAYDFFPGIGDLNSTFLPKKAEVKRDAKIVQAQVKLEGEKAAAAERAEEAADTDTSRAPSDNAAADDDGLTAIEQQLVALAGGDTSKNIDELNQEHDQAIEAQLEDRPLLKLQEKMDKVLDEQEAAKATPNGDNSGNGETIPEAQKQKHTLLHDDDDELQHLEHALLSVHTAFYDEYEQKLAGSQGGRIAELRGERSAKRRAVDDFALVPDIKEVMPRVKNVLHGCVIVFTGVVKLEFDIWHPGHDLANWARSFGARIDTDVSSTTTHVVAHRGKRTDRMKKAARRPSIKIVTKDWLLDVFSTWQRQDEEPYRIDVELDASELQHIGSANRDLISALEHENDDLSGTDDEDLMTEATATEADNPDVDADSKEEEEAQKSPIDKIAEDDWADMNKELADELGSDFDEDESDEYQSDTSNDSRHSRTSRDSRRNERSLADRSRKRKRGDTSAEPSDNEAEEGKAALNGQGSSLQRRKKKAFERVSSLTNVATAADSGSGLPSPEATGPEETGADKDTKTGSTSNTEDAGDMDEDDLAAEFAAELEREMSAEGEQGGGGG